MSYYSSDLIAEHIKDRPISIVVPGGKTPILIYKNLFKKKINFSNICFILSDERLVKSTNNNSNYGMLSNIIQNSLPEDKRPKILPRMDLFNNFKVNKFIDYTNNALMNCPKIEFAFLGIGKDGHTASLFPNDEISDMERYYYKVKYNEDYERITLSMNFLCKIQKIFFIASGKSKQKAIKNILSQKRNDLPASQLINYHSGSVNFIINEINV